MGAVKRRGAQSSPRAESVGTVDDGGRVDQRSTATLAGSSMPSEGHAGGDGLRGLGQKAQRGVEGRGDWRPQLHDRGSLQGTRLHGTKKAAGRQLLTMQRLWGPHELAGRTERSRLSRSRGSRDDAGHEPTEGPTAVGRPLDGFRIEHRPPFQSPALTAAWPCPLTSRPCVRPGGRSWISEGRDP